MPHEDINVAFETITRLDDPIGIAICSLVLEKTKNEIRIHRELVNMR